ncbi:carboxyphosphonoenolpyruvate mutase [Fomitopsis serialis]|uniref:carboxyphosphonoenolpyruvate mutase n=1 Tax=Fomitopsis serialis TaxID=139415 RepID=UPI0020085EB5|nr:carboxyphosphonoenolpyruvate mutase [Neoantrodia serialis]KAH9926452.1 carboxyphosphonoenolpyruvate mutase [Neoantrodia serialis]
MTTPTSFKPDMPSKLRKLMNEKDCIICPGVFDGISAHVANSAGFDCLYLAGSGASGSVIGEPDLSVITGTELANTARMITQVSDVPVIADADTGFGGPLNVARTMRCMRAQGLPKRCGQLNGKDVVDMETYLERIVAAVRARRNPDFLIIARTDARNAVQFGGGDAGEEAFEEGVKRLKAALEAGADVAFMESPRTMEESGRLVKALAPHPVMINVLPNGLTGNYKVEDCKRLGFKLAIYPCTGFIPATIAMEKSYAALRDQGTDLDNCEGWQIKDFFERVGLKPSFDFDRSVAENVRQDVKPSRYEEMSGHDLF